MADEGTCEDTTLICRLRHLLYDGVAFMTSTTTSSCRYLHSKADQAKQLSLELCVAMIRNLSSAVLRLSTEIKMCSSQMSTLCLDFLAMVNIVHLVHGKYHFLSLHNKA